MKIRIGYGLGTQTLANDAAVFGDLVDALEGLRFDSLWMSERLTGDAPDPLTALAFAAGRTTRLKLGTSVLVLPGRNPVVLAKELASLDRLSGGRLLPAVGLGAPSSVEHRAFGVARAERAPWFDEALALMRRLWTEDDVHHDGERFRVEGVTLRPRPVQQPIEVWLGGRAPSELRRVGRVGDGWLPSFSTVRDVEDGWKVITETAAAHDRSIDPEHLGVLVAYARGEVPELMRAFLAARQPETDPTEVIPVGLDGLRRHLESLIEVGASKFVVVPLVDHDDWERELTDVADAVFDLQN
ncbi:MAG: TIGR03619 family F420-dependent LLM class oxidoreductase [Microthrixaceae bacterium]